MIKAVILAAGKGKRMRHLTRETPKPLLPIHGKPILERLIEQLRDEAAIREIFIVIGYLGGKIREHFADGAAWDVSLSYGIQQEQNGTGKAPEPARDWVGSSRFLLTNGDCYLSPGTFAHLISEFREDGVIALKESTELIHGGAVELSPHGHLSRIVEKAEAGTVQTPWLNAGIYGLDPRLFDYTARLQLSPRGEYEITDALNAMAAQDLRIKGVPLPGQWTDVRDPETLSTLDRDQHDEIH